MLQKRLHSGGVFLWLFFVAVIGKLAYYVNMKYSILFLLLLIVMPAQADEIDVYRSVDKQGNVEFSDRPSNNAKKIEVQLSPSYTPAAIPPPSSDATTSDDPQEELAPKYKVEIISPEYDENLWGTGGTASVSVNISPRLNAKRGDQVVYILDGVDVGEPGFSTSITLTNLERGSHTLVASVVDKAGKAIKNSKSILFHIHQQTARRPTPG